jgi:hypothetical protein
MYSFRHMAQFVVAGDDDARLAPVLAQIYPNVHVKAWTGLYFVSDSVATASEVGQKLGITNGRCGRVIVTSMVGYWGWGPRSVWEW